ncbi:hypothetical protein [Lysobacter sp. CA199]|uniref:hypothetical protein n=1 Tax=Lysobacter sp. CA199 TaxID=3455608 RepID=UPI003F8D7B1B
MKKPHAITPTDTRSKPGPLSRPPTDADVDGAESSELRRLAIQIADSAARSDIEVNCGFVTDPAGVTWYDTDHAFFECDRALIDVALRYLQVRGVVRCHPVHANRVTFPEIAE